MGVKIPRQAKVICRSIVAVGPPMLPCRVRRQTDYSRLSSVAMIHLPAHSAMDVVATLTLYFKQEARIAVQLDSTVWARWATYLMACMSAARCPALVRLLV